MKGATRRLVRLYPRAWRERYEEEFLAMLEQRPASVSDFLDVALGVLEAWLRPQVVSEGGRVLRDGMRNSVLVVLWAWVGVVMAGVGFQKMAEYDDFAEAARRSAGVGLAFDAVVVGAVVALAAILTGGAPVAFDALRGALAEGRKDTPLLFCVPPLSLATFVGYALLLVRVVYPALGPLAVHAPLNVRSSSRLSGRSCSRRSRAWGRSRPPRGAPRSGSAPFGSPSTLPG